MRSKLCATTAFTPSSFVPLAAQSRDEPVPYSCPARMISGVLRRLIFHRRVVNAHLLAVGLKFRHAAFDARHHQILDAHIGERAARHHAVVAATRAVAVEILRRHAVLDADIFRRAKFS